MVSCVPDVIEHERSLDDEYIVIACDGLWEVKNNNFVANFIKNKIF